MTIHDAERILSPNPCKKRRRFRMSRRSVDRTLQILPHVITLANAFFGFCSVVAAAQGNVVLSAYFILLGALMDVLDGRVARLAGVCSALGVQLDSLCDAISFCVAPAFLIYSWQLSQMGFVGVLVGAMFVMAGVLRLAYFNVTVREQAHDFIGMPTTIAGCFLATLVIASFQGVVAFIPVYAFACGMIVLATLMVSAVRFPTFKQVDKHAYVIAVPIFISCAVVIGLVRMLLALYVVYFAGVLVRASVNQLRLYRR